MGDVFKKTINVMAAMTVVIIATKIIVLLPQVRYHFCPFGFLYCLLDGQKRARCNKSVDILKPISGCVPMACDSLLTTSLLQVVNRLGEVDCQNLLSTGLLQVDKLQQT